MQYRSALANVRGLGSAKEGTHHFWAQRVSAVALVPLTIWFAAALVSVSGADYASAVAWLRSPLNSVLLVGMLIAMFYHAYLGVQVVIEDYVSTEGRKIVILVLVKLVLFALCIAALLSVLKVSLGAAA